MATLIYFGRDFSEQVGDPMLCFHAEAQKWTTVDELASILDTGEETVTIRHANFVEFLKAESHLALVKIENGMCDQLRQLAELITGGSGGAPATPGAGA